MMFDFKSRDRYQAKYSHFILEFPYTETRVGRRLPLYPGLFLSSINYYEINKYANH